MIPALFRKIGRSKATRPATLIAGLLPGLLALSFNIWPEIAKNRRTVAWLLVTAIAVFGILAAVLPLIRQRYKALVAVLRFRGGKIYIVTGAGTDVHGSDYMPPYDGEAAANFRESLASVGLTGEVHHCRSKNLPRSQVRDLVLICGPAMNSWATDINQKLMERYDAFAFHRNATAISAGPPEIGWSIRHRSLPGLEIAAAHRPAIGAAADWGVFYVGPNPTCHDHWLLWIAGLGNVATHGVAKLLRETSVLSELTVLLSTSDSYVSGLVRYDHDVSEAEKGRPMIVALSHGRAPSVS